MEQLWRSFGKVIPLTWAILPILLIVGLVLTLHRKRRMPARAALMKSVLDMLSLLSILPVLYLVAFPVFGPTENHSVSLVPGAEISKVFAEESNLWQALGNLALLAPIGALVPIRYPAARTWIRSGLILLAASCAIEALQWLLPLGRITAVDDVILNVTGGMLGAALTRFWWGRRPTSRERTATLVRHPTSVGAGGRAVAGGPGGTE
ncbi:VanZ family protein [Actinokineospora enzanensis]|uniref:VanZ family protein n=1 Tax=Actinokineospora enzanensis TaxID=155975 RepID=UPI0004757B58|nr:VanZ family protein [Actinokineospora enzanensis]